MENPRELMVRTSHIPDGAEMQVLKAIAANAVASKLYPSVGPENAILMILLTARELGIPPMQALNGGIWNIKGRIEISSRQMCSMIRHAGHSIQADCNDQRCIVKGTRSDNGDTCTTQFTVEDAKKAGLLGSTSWQKYTEDMLYSRAISRLARRLFPDVIGSAYVEGEIRDAQMEVIEDTTELKEDCPWRDVEIFCDAWGDKANLFMRYMQEKVKEKKLLFSEFMDMCKKHPDQVEKGFEVWLEHKVENDVALL